MDSFKRRYIVVEGPIGAGKTSLARLLAGLDGAELLLEQPESNPFLADFYQDPAPLGAGHPAVSSCSSA